MPFGTNGHTARAWDVCGCRLVATPVFLTDVLPSWQDADLKGNDCQYAMDD